MLEDWTTFSEQVYRFLDTIVQNQAAPDSQAVPAEPHLPPVSGKVVLGTAALTPCPHVSGARITIVSQTASNDDDVLFHGVG